MGGGELLTVKDVEPQSIAEEVGIEPGDILISINGSHVKDIIDYYYLSSDEFLDVEIKKPSGSIWVLDIEKDPDEDLGIEFKSHFPGGIRSCNNNCVFCFINQLPPGMRKSLYVKDDDYRHSFLYGNYISLTNLKPEDWERIARFKLSPLYVSVHTTSPRLRAKMMRNPQASNIIGQLGFLREAGITVHAQVVVCPGINDGVQLERTLRDLFSFWPTVLSAAVVPVGVTKYQKYESPFFPVDKEKAQETIELVEQLQREFKKTAGTNFAFLADEFYLKAEKPVPPANHYEDFPQTENGVGLVRIFLDDFKELLSMVPSQIKERSTAVITGKAMEKIMKELCKELENKVQGLKVDVIPVNNKFFGNTVDVVGLLTGKDVFYAVEEYLNNKGRKDILILIPSVLLKEGKSLFLDGMSVQDLQRKTRAVIKVVENSAQGLISGALGQGVE
ncbi:MAG: DUF512 domain-containing protein [Clostridia bacterium]|nr:DUF512 domain-containing protein [Clostridia bacterium]